MGVERYAFKGRMRRGAVDKRGAAAA